MCSVCFGFAACEFVCSLDTLSVLLPRTLRIRERVLLPGRGLGGGGGGGVALLEDTSHLLLLCSGAAALHTF